MEQTTRQVALTCSYLPPEIPLLLGLQPLRPCPDRNDLRAAEGYLPRDSCPYARGLVGRMARRRGEYFAVALTTCCDALRRAADALAHFALVEHVFLLDLPRRPTSTARQYYAAELRRWAAELALRSGRDVGDGITWPPVAPPRGGEGWTALLSPLAELSCPAPPPAPATPGPRLVVGGTCLLDTSIPAALAGLEATVVALDTCLGERDRPAAIPRTGDPWLDLATAYLTRPPCPRMQDPAGRRAWLEVLLGRGADGLLWFGPKFCDQAAYELPWLKKTFPQTPLLHLEGEVGAGETGSARTRLEAFCEELSFRRRL